MNPAVLKAQIASSLSPRFLKLKAARELAQGGTLAALQVVREVLPQLDAELLNVLLDLWPASGRHELCELLLGRRTSRAVLQERFSQPAWSGAAARALLQRPDDELAVELLQSPPEDPGLRSLLYLAAGRIQEYEDLDFDQSRLRGLLAGASVASRTWLLGKLAQAGRGDLVVPVASADHSPLAWMPDEEFEARIELLGADLLRRLGEMRPDQAARLLARVERPEEWARLPIPTPEKVREHLQQPSVLWRWPEEPGQAIAVSPRGTSQAYADGERVWISDPDGNLRSVEHWGVRELAVSDNGAWVWATDGFTTKAWHFDEMLWEHASSRVLAGLHGVALLSTERPPRIWFVLGEDPPTPSAYVDAPPVDWTFYARGTQLAIPVERGSLLSVRVGRGDQAWLQQRHDEPIRTVVAAHGCLGTASVVEAVLWTHDDEAAFLLNAALKVRLSAYSLAVSDQMLAVGHGHGVGVYSQQRRWTLESGPPTALQFTRLGLLVADSIGRVRLWNFRRGHSFMPATTGFPVRRWQGMWAIGDGQAARVSPVLLADQPLLRFPVAAVPGVDREIRPFLEHLVSWVHRYSLQLGTEAELPGDSYDIELED